MDADVVSGRNFWKRVQAFRLGAFGPKPPEYLARRIKEYDPRAEVRWHHNVAGRAFTPNAGRWVLWRKVSRYVPQGYWNGNRIIVAMDVPHLIAVWTEPPRDGQQIGDFKHLSTELLQRMAYWSFHRPGGKDQRLRDLDAQDEAVDRQVETMIEARLHEAALVEWNAGTPHVYVPTNYGE